jgi:hypothetical protein
VGDRVGQQRNQLVDVAPDDQHFVMITGGAAQTTLIGVEKVFQRLEYERRTQR